MSDRVFVRDPDRPERNGYVSQRAFDNLWSKKGYEIVQPSGERVEPDSGDERDPLAEPVPEDNADDTDQLNAELDEKAQLRAVLDQRGIEYDGRLGVKRLRELVEKTA